MNTDPPPPPENGWREKLEALPLEHQIFLGWVAKILARKLVQEKRAAEKKIENELIGNTSNEAEKESAEAECRRISMSLKINGDLPEK